MKTYFRNETIIKKNTYINQIFQITKGHITNKKGTEIYKPKDYLFLDQIFYNPYTLDDYIALDLVAGQWIDKSEIDFSYFSILSQILLEKKNHVELLLIQDPIIKVSRYILFEYRNKKTESFYFTFSIAELAIFLNLRKETLSQTLLFLKDKKIIDKHNKLLNIINLSLLEKYAYRLDW
ncbi:MAG: hypothetical protein K2I42_07020 [Anaeroplasmataceae bacterium]|nr:hypothetical protein [Anaeroplasmataceae bacterium]